MIPEWCLVFLFIAEAAPPRQRQQGATLSLHEVLTRLVVISYDEHMKIAAVRSTCTHESALAGGCRG